MKGSRKAGRKAGRTPGRPLAFDPEKAIEKALRVFWKHGYEAASLTDLTKAMGINRPSMYATFGNKQELFRKALDKYADSVAGHVREGLSEPEARRGVERMLLKSAELMSDPRQPKGCLLVQGALACGDEGKAIQRELCSRRTSGEGAIRERLERAKLEGDLPASVAAGDLAAYLTTVIHGMSVQAASGASREKLRGIAERAMKAWPE